MVGKSFIGRFKDLEPYAPIEVNSVGEPKFIQAYPKGTFFPTKAYVENQIMNCCLSKTEVKEAIEKLQYMWTEIPKDVETYIKHLKQELGLK